jgi:hypothetical protein
VPSWAAHKAVEVGGYDHGEGRSDVQKVQEGGMKDMVQHHTDIKKQGVKPTTWVVVCSCGYQSRPYERKRDADNDEGEHVRLMTYVKD